MLLHSTPHLRATMRYILFLALALLSQVPTDGYHHQQQQQSQIWAVLVAGSNGWGNYRHQADVCHAYQILRNHGVPDERIIVMMYDDIAYNHMNKWNGTIINHPKGKDVYSGVPRDYTRKLVNPKNFINVLLGKKKEMQNVGSGKVLESGPNDHVFINFVDHGAHGLVAFPDSELTVGELTKTLNEMREKKKYGKMLIYMEACESGSMFHGHLPADVQIYATTAANGHESSYACYYDNILQTYLGDSYSVNWMEDSDQEDLSKESILRQFKLVRDETNSSHVKAHGDRSVAQLVLAEFFGVKKANKPPRRYLTGDRRRRDEVPSRDVPLELIRRRMDSNEVTSDDASTEYQQILKKREYFDKFFGELILQITSNLDVDPNWMMKRHRDQPITQLDCHDNLVHTFSTFCYNLGKNPYALKYGYVFVNICERRLPIKLVLSKMLAFCTTGKRLYQKIE